MPGACWGCEGRARPSTAALCEPGGERSAFAVVGVELWPKFACCSAELCLALAVGCAAGLAAACSPSELQHPLPAHQRFIGANGHSSAPIPALPPPSVSILIRLLSAHALPACCVLPAALRPALWAACLCLSVCVRVGCSAAVPCCAAAPGLPQPPLSAPRRKGEDVEAALVHPDRQLPLLL